MVVYRGTGLMPGGFREQLPLGLYELTDIARPECVNNKTARFFPHKQTLIRARKNTLNQYLKNTQHKAPQHYLNNYHPE